MAFMLKSLWHCVRPVPFKTHVRAHLSLISAVFTEQNYFVRFNMCFSLSVLKVLCHQAERRMGTLSRKLHCCINSCVASIQEVFLVVALPRHLHNSAVAAVIVESRLVVWVFARMVVHCRLLSYCAGSSDCLIATVWAISARNASSEMLSLPVCTENVAKGVKRETLHLLALFGGGFGDSFK